MICLVMSALNGQIFKAHDIRQFPGEFNSHDKIHVDDASNMYIVGRGSGAIDFDFGPSVNGLSDASDKDLYLVKYDENFNLEWLNAFSGSDFAEIRNIETDIEGNIYISGIFNGSLNLGTDPSLEMFTASNGNMVVAKFNSEGMLLWNFSIGNEENSQFASESFLSDGKLFIHMDYTGTVDVDPGPGVSNVEGSNTDVLLVYDLDGNFINSYKHTGGTSVKTSLVDDEGNIYMVGTFSGLSSLDYNSNFSLISIGISDVFVVKYDKDLNLIWQKKYGKSQRNTRLDKATLDSNQDLVLIGSVFGETIFGSFQTASDAIHTVNISKEGNVTNVTAMFSIDADVYDLSMTSEDDMLITAAFDESIDVDPSEGVVEFTVEGEENKFLAIYNKDFELLDADQIFAPFLSSYSMNINSGDEISIAIDFQNEGKVLFGDTNLYTPEGPSENFIVYSLNLDGCTTTTTAFEVIACDEVALGDSIITTSGEFEVVMTDDFGCDSILLFYVTINESQETELMIDACDVYENNGIVYNESGTYTLDLQTSNGCDSTVTLNLNITSIDESITIQDTQIIASEDDGDSYQWFDCTTDLPIENGTNKVYTPQTSGIYRVEIVKNGCSKVSECVQFDVVSTIDIFSEVKIVPNPSDGMLEIHMKDMSLNTQISILDIAGRVVLQTNLNNSDRITLDLSYLEEGMYMVRFETEGAITAKKILIY